MFCLFVRVSYDSIVHWVGLGWVGLVWVGLGWVGSRFLNFNWVGLVWVRQSMYWLGWVGLGWFGLGWVGSRFLNFNWIGLVWVSQSMYWVGLDWVTYIKWTHGQLCDDGPDVAYWTIQQTRNNAYLFYFTYKIVFGLTGEAANNNMFALYFGSLHSVNTGGHAILRLQTLSAYWP